MGQSDRYCIADTYIWFDVEFSVWRTHVNDHRHRVSNVTWSIAITNRKEYKILSHCCIERYHYARTRCRPAGDRRVRWYGPGKSFTCKRHSVVIVADGRKCTSGRALRKNEWPRNFKMNGNCQRCPWPFAANILAHVPCCYTWNCRCWNRSRSERSATRSRSVPLQARTNSGKRRCRITLAIIKVYGKRCGR